MEAAAQVKRKEKAEKESLRSQRERGCGRPRGPRARARRQGRGQGNPDPEFQVIDILHHRYTDLVTNKIQLEPYSEPKTPTRLMPTRSGRAERSMWALVEEDKEDQ